MKLETNWTCPVCDEVIGIRLDAVSAAVGAQVEVRIAVADAGLADAYAHAWAHRG